MLIMPRDLGYPVTEAALPEICELISRQVRLVWGATPQPPPLSLLIAAHPGSSDCPSPNPFSMQASSLLPP